MNTYILLHWSQEGWYAHEVVKIVERGGNKAPMVGAVSLNDRTSVTSWYPHGNIEGLPVCMVKDDHEFRLATLVQVMGMNMLGHNIRIIERETSDALPA